METRYYSGKGRPGGEHKLALHASRKVFERITGHLDRKERLKDDSAMEAAHRKFLKDATKAMTSQWENSVENLRKKKEEARQQRLAQKADDRVERYFKIIKRQAEERERYNKEVKEKIFQMRGAQRDINSSVLFSECLYANERHMEHKNKEKEKANADWEQFDQQLIREDEAFKKDEQVKACKKRAVAKKHMEFIRNQILERANVKEEKKKIKMEAEKADIKKQLEEMDIIQQNTEEKFLNAKRCSLKILKESREEAEKIRQTVGKKDAELDTVCSIFRDTKTKINCAREMMRKTDIEKRLNLQRAAFQKLEEINSQKLNNEEQILVKQIAEIDEREAQKIRLREEYDDKLLKERKQDYKNTIRNELDKIEIDKEKRKWETLNRMKLIEICDSEKEQKEESKLRKIKEYKEMLDEQVKENEERRAEKRAKEDEFKWNDYPEQDRMFLEYGAEMLAKQKSAGKSTYPIELTIMEYKKKHRLISPKSKISGEREEEKAKDALKLPIITRRVCPTKNISPGVQDCFCIA